LTFLAPLLLLAAASLAVPLLLHLFRKRPGTIQTFPALRYLERTTRERARIVRLRQLLLLAVRLAALALLVLAAARLVLPLGGGDQPPAGVVLVVDNGLASARVVGDRRVLDHLLVQARDALDRTGPDDRIWVLPAGEPWRPVFPMDRERARAALDALEPSGVRADLRVAVNRARSLLDAGAPPLRQILVLSDLDAASVPAGGGDGHPAEEIPLLVGTPDLEPPPNRGFAEVSVGGGLTPRAGTAGEVSVRVAGDPAADQAVRLHVEDRLVAGVRTDEGGRAILSLPPAAEGWLDARLELDPDALRIDDVHYLALPIRPPPRVRTVGDPPSYLATALEVLAARDRIAPRGTDPSATALREVGVEAGGRVIPGRRPTLLFPPTDPAVLPAANQRLADLGTGWRFEMPEGREEALVTDGEAPGLRLPEGLEVLRRYLLAPVDAEGRGAGEARVLVRLSDGSPWVVHVPEGERDDLPGVLLVGSPPEPDATRLPTSAAMVPFLGAALELLDGGDLVAGIEAGEPLRLPEGAHTVRPPSGTPVTVDGISSFLETGRPGIYDILGPDGELLGRTAVNPRPAPEVEARLSPEEAASRLGPNAVGTSGRRAWARGVLEERRGREVWRPLLLAALLLLVAEGWLAAGGAAARRPVLRAEAAGEARVR
jgi:hypothetical protein